MCLYSIYIHIPFCQQRCSYCDFNTYAGLDSLIPEYIHALKTEIQIIARLAEKRLSVHTIFFGGGTPSILPPEAIGELLETIDTCYSLQPNPEITLESNPGTLSLDTLINLREYGVNRISLGVQSTNASELNLLGRIHNFWDVIQAVSWVRQAGFNNLNLDLIFGIPEQSMQDWLTTLDRILEFAPEHLSLYALTLESGTPMSNWVERGLLGEPDADQAAEMYEVGTSRLSEAGYAQYEISNWACQRESAGIMACQHNLQYWHNQPYLGFGAGAHSYAGGFRIANVASPYLYVERITKQKHDWGKKFPFSPVSDQFESISRETEIAETMILGLRLVQEGVSTAAFFDRFGISLESIYEDQIKKLMHLGLVEWGDEGVRCLRLTNAGRLLGNQVFIEFL